MTKAFIFTDDETALIHKLIDEFPRCWRKKFHDATENKYPDSRVRSYAACLGLNAKTGAKYNAGKVQYDFSPEQDNLIIKCFKHSNWIQIIQRRIGGHYTAYAIRKRAAKLGLIRDTAPPEVRAFNDKNVKIDGLKHFAERPSIKSYEHRDGSVFRVTFNFGNGVRVQRVFGAMS